MAPAPFDDVDFPALRDKILELLRALWTFVSDICIALWSYISQAFWAVWTYPPFEAFRNEFAAALIALMDYATAHPLTSAAIFILAFIFVPTVLNTLRITILHCLSFSPRERGVLLGSYTTSYQSTRRGARGERR